MRESIGSIALYNIIIIFIAVTFAVLAGTMSYSKAFKVNNRIINAIEKYEGYNDLAASKIDDTLLSIGYQQEIKTYECPKRQGIAAMNSLNPNFHFCVYQFPEKTLEWNGRYNTYGVVTYINIDLPIIDNFLKIPVYGRSKMIFTFSGSSTQANDITKVLKVKWNPEKIEPYMHNGRVQFKQDDSYVEQHIREFIIVTEAWSDGIEIGRTADYGINYFSTATIGENQELSVRKDGAEPGTISYDVVAN